MKKKQLAKKALTGFILALSLPAAAQAGNAVSGTLLAAGCGSGGKGCAASNSRQSQRGCAAANPQTAQHGCAAANSQPSHGCASANPQSGHGCGSATSTPAPVQPNPMNRSANPADQQNKDWNTQNNQPSSNGNWANAEPVTSNPTNGQNDPNKTMNGQPAMHSGETAWNQQNRR